MKKIIILYSIAAITLSCNKKPHLDSVLQGKVERDEISIVGKVAGRIDRILVSEGDFVKKGDTLAILDIPEVEAKKSQAQGAVLSAKAQYDMSVKGATANQLKQLNAKKSALKEQYEFAQKSLKRLEAMVQDSLIPQQQYDEVFAKYQGAKAQLIAVDAEIADVQHGVRVEQQNMALGQQDRALGALQEVETAEKERYIVAPQDMTIENITLRTGELALPGYTLFTGSLNESTTFRFTIAESQLSQFEKGKEVTLHVPYNNSSIKGKVKNIKKLGSYANIATAYPDYEMQDALYEVTISPENNNAAAALLSQSTVTINQ
ncbi:efflux RND transporter periplasmic adaptor subunit [Myroides ceti]|uniref:Efflux RND transporter periplasmic adaptor subunit n=1 Tax=Paenimyroides ceti TaxID=395087 RepID=A0ABT8CSC2_9FLAO|nr:biotin/lipoyl-binding protein [Paenimyroides ceti]MDN3706861.1 efflux RND transporter periplasmic adaptor subunit [Paenimyroides ceti]